MPYRTEGGSFAMKKLKIENIHSKLISGGVSENESGHKPNEIEFEKIYPEKSDNKTRFEAMTEAYQNHKAIFNP